MLDYAVISRTLGATGVIGRVLGDAPWAPHLPVVFDVPARPRYHTARRQLLPRRLPDVPFEDLGSWPAAAATAAEARPLVEANRALEPALANFRDELPTPARAAADAQQRGLEELCLTAEVRVLLAAGLPAHPRDLLPYLGRGFIPKFSVSPVVPSCPKDGCPGTGAISWWRNLAVRCRGVCAASADSPQQRRSARWFASAVPHPGPPGKGAVLSTRSLAGFS